MTALAFALPLSPDAPPLSPDAPAAPAYGIDASDAADFALRPNDVCFVLSSNPDCREFVRVEKLLCNDTAVVSNLVYRGIQRRVGIDDLRIAVAREAVEVGNGVEA